MIPLASITINLFNGDSFWALLALVFLLAVGIAIIGTTLQYFAERWHKRTDLLPDNRKAWQESACMTALWALAIESETEFMNTRTPKLLAGEMNRLLDAWGLGMLRVSSDQARLIAHGCFMRKDREPTTLGEAFVAALGTRPATRPATRRAAAHKED